MELSFCLSSLPSLNQHSFLLLYLSPPSHAHTHTHTQLLAIIVFGCVSDKVDVDNTCHYNGSNACSFDVAVGVIAFLLCLTFLIKDVLYVVIDYSNNIVVSDRSYILCMYMYFPSKWLHDMSKLTKFCGIYSNSC